MTAPKNGASQITSSTLPRLHHNSAGRRGLPGGRFVVLATTEDPHLAAKLMLQRIEEGVEGRLGLYPDNRPGGRQVTHEEFQAYCHGSDTAVTVFV